MLLNLLVAARAGRPFSSPDNNISTVKKQRDTLNHEEESIMHTNLTVRLNTAAATRTAIIVAASYWVTTMKIGLLLTRYEKANSRRRFLLDHDMTTKGPLSTMTMKQSAPLRERRLEHYDNDCVIERHSADDL